MAGGMLGRNDCYSLAECVDTTVQPGSGDNRPVALTQGKRGRSADRAFPLGINFILLGVAASRTSDALHVFLIGVMLNIPRYLFFGIVVGYLYKGLYGSTRAQIEGNGLSGYSIFKGDKK